MADTGRPTSMTPEVIRKLEEVFALGGTDKEACFWADISPETLYSYQRTHPEFTERKEALKQQPILKARQTVVRSLNNPRDAQWFLERKSSEFKQKTDITTNDKDFPTPLLANVISTNNQPTEDSQAN